MPISVENKKIFDKIPADDAAARTRAANPTHDIKENAVVSDPQYDSYSVL